MKRKYILISLPLLLLFSIVFFTSCEKEKVEPPDNKTEDSNTQDTIAQLNKAFYNLMNEWYYWYEEIPDIDPDDFNNPSEMLNEIRYEKDSYSYVTSYEAFQQYYDEGAYIGYGFGYKWDADDSLRITFVFEDSPFTEEGIERGWAITEVNGSSVGSPDSYSLGDELGANKVGVENTFKFKSPDGRTVEATFTSKKISMNTVLKDTIIEYEGKDVGYLVLKSFINKTPDELTDVFQKFADENIDDLVVDLRYNGGGTLSASRFLGEFIYEAGSKDIYVEISHNDTKSERDTTHVFGQDSLNINLGLNNVYFLTTQATASASEALINGLKPFMNVYSIGKATYGKPVGMYAFFDSNDEYAFLPVCFALKNDAGDADYYDGLQPSPGAELADDFKQPFGSLDDDLLYQALHHIDIGSFDTKKTREIRMLPRPENRVEYKSLQDEIGAL